MTLERTGPRVALLCTRGFRDILEIARLAKPGTKLYTHKSVMPEPVVTRRDSFEITERVDRSLYGVDVIEDPQRVDGRWVASGAQR